jgi:plastocyanin
MKKLLALLVLALALGLVVAGCGDDEEEDGGDEPAATQQDTGGATDTGVGTQTGGGGGETPVSIGDNFFEPEQAEVRAGATVTWTNDGQVAHTVTKTGGPGDEFDSGTLEPGGEFSTKVAEPGMIEYVCTIHAGQMGTLTVE